MPTSSPIRYLCMPVVLLTTLVAVAGAADGAAIDAPAAVDGTVQVSLDNDAFTAADDHYTNGVQIGWVSGYLHAYTQPEAPVPTAIGACLDRMPLIGRAGRQRFISYSLSQRIFTPDDITDPELIVDDLPYSALLFGTFTAGAQDERSMDAFSVSLGLVRPSAQGEEIQSKVHSLVSSDEPAGWDNQLQDEVLLNLWYEHRRRLLRYGGTDGWAGDVILQGGVAAGNLASMATAGVGLRWGWQLPDDYAVPPQFFSEETVGSRPWSSRHRQAWWIFVHANASVFGNAIFWDGNSFRDSHRIDYDPWIGRLYAGMSGQLGAWGLGFSYVATTVPWDNPDDSRIQFYGRLAISYSH